MQRAGCVPGRPLSVLADVEEQRAFVGEPAGTGRVDLGDLAHQ
jgi:hypothetical protein